MSKLVKFLVFASLIAGAISIVPDRAEAYWRHRYWGWGPAAAFAWGGYPYYPYYARPHYYAVPACGYVSVKVWRHGHWVLRRARQC